MVLIRFILLSNITFVALLFFSDYLTGWLAAKFVNDYFFYSAIAQSLVGSFFMVSGKDRNSLANSPFKNTKITASMIETRFTERFKTSAADIRLSNRLFISGAVSMLICFII